MPLGHVVRLIVLAMLFSVPVFLIAIFFGFVVEDALDWLVVLFGGFVIAFVIYPSWLRLRAK